MKNDRFMLIDGSNKVICEGVVKELFRGEGEFQVANGMAALKEFGVGDIVRFAFKDGRKGVFQGEIVDILNNKIILEEIRSLGNAVKEDIRVNTDFQSRVYMKDDEGQIIAKNVVIADISAGGLRVLVNSPLPMHRIIEVAIPYYTEYIIVQMQVMREIENDRDREFFRKKHSYGCQFHDLLNTEESMIRGMVFYIGAKAAKSN